MAEELKIATWNVRGNSTKELELTKVEEEKQINIAVITETKNKLKGTQYTRKIHNDL
jgi:hypothetical protein